MDLNNHRYEFKIIDDFLEITFSNRFKLILNLNNISIQKSKVNKSHFIIKDDYFYLELDYTYNNNFKNSIIDGFMFDMCILLFNQCESSIKN